MRETRATTHEKWPRAPATKRMPRQDAACPAHRPSFQGALHGFWCHGGIAARFSSAGSIVACPRRFRIGGLSIAAIKATGKPAGLDCFRMLFNLGNGVKKSIFVLMAYPAGNGRFIYEVLRNH